MISHSLQSTAGVFASSSNGWSVLYNWASTIKGHSPDQIKGYAIISQHLGRLASQTDSHSLIADPAERNTPAEFSESLVSLDGTKAAEQLGELISGRLARRLISETCRLQKIGDGCEGYEEFLNKRYRQSVIDRLRGELRNRVMGSDQSERDFRVEAHAGLAANDALPAVAQFLSLMETNPHFFSQDFEALRQKMSQHMSPAVLPELRDQVRHAFDIYLDLLGF